MQKWYLITYDVRDDKRLRRTAQTLEGYGTRLQDSVFRCRLSDRGIEELRWKLSQVLEPADDLLVIGLCETCAQKVRTRSGPDPWAAEATRKKYEVLE